MERYRSYPRLVSALRSTLTPDWTNLALCFEHLSLSERKAGITLFRARALPLYNNSTYDMKVQPFIRAIPQYLHTTNNDHYRILEEIINQPDTASVFLSFLLSAPYDSETVAQIYSDMVIKEMKVMESTPKRSEVQWHHLYTRDQPLHIDFRPSANTNRSFRQIIDRWSRQLQENVIYPFSSTKTLSRITTREFNRLSGNHFDDICPLQLEQYYAETGQVIESPCEMRQVWYPTQAVPRTYYAMGGTAYFRSRYLRDIFNVLADMLPSTNRYTRVQPSHTNFGIDEEVFVYDLTSFTSMFHEQRYFLSFLARILDGLEVVLFDTHTGFRKVLISDLILEYNDLNSEPEYTVERVWNVDLVLHHSVAGFLGVYGNLITCTIPHGLCLMSLRDESLKSWCAGDDDGGSIGNGVIRDQWLSNGDKLLSMAVRMGYVEREEVRVTYTQYEDVRAAVYREYLRDSNRASVVYQYTLIDNIPVYYSLE